MADEDRPGQRRRAGADTPGPATRRAAGAPKGAPAPKRTAGPTWAPSGPESDAGLHGRTALATSADRSELERQRRRSDTLLALSSVLSGAADRAEIEHLVCTFVRTASRAPFAMVGRRDPEADRFVVAATDGLDADQVARIEAALRRTDRPSLKELIGGGIPTRSGEQAVGTGMRISNAMAAPIAINGRTEGFIAIGAPSGEIVRPAEWQELLVAFAALTATALARADAVGALARQRDILASEVEERTRSLRVAMDELRLASDAKTDFLANVSHELRTPLTAILGFVEIIAGGMDGPVNPEQARDLETIQLSGRHLLELIDHLIDIASIDSGRVRLKIGRVAADDVVRDAIETIRPLAVAKGLSLEVRLEPPAEGAGSMIVAADRGRLREIVLNLLSNAVKFTPPAGRVVVTTASAGPSRGELDRWPATAIVAISVRDTGPGIEIADRERIFEKFVRIGTSATPGTGLGLPISRELARLHGGDLTVDSVPGMGSTFTVHLPRAEG